MPRCRAAPVPAGAPGAAHVVPRSWTAWPEGRRPSNVAHRTAQPAQKGVAFHGSGLARQLPTLVVDDQRRDAADSEAAGELGFGFGIDFAEAHLRFDFSGGSLKHRCEGAAGP